MDAGYYLLTLFDGLCESYKIMAQKSIGLIKLDQEKCAT